MLGLRNLHGYQFTSSDHILDNPYCGLLLDMGLGKTVSTLTAINILMYEELEIKKVLVIAPKRVAENVWTSEIKEWQHLKHLKTSRIIGTEKQRLAALKEKADVYTIGRDNVAWLCGVFGGSMLPFDMLVIDESSSFKNQDSLRFKALKKVRGCFKRIVILTGTVAPNGLIDVWAQIYLLDGGERLGRTLTEYRHRYFTAGARKGYVVYNYDIKKNYEHLIYKRIEDICISMKTEDYLKNLPERVDNYVKVYFPKALRQRYKEFKRDRVLELLEEEGIESVSDITAGNAAALGNKLLQFTNGAVYDEDKNWHEIHKLKLEALKDIVEDANGKNIIVAYSFKHDADRILKLLKKYKPVKLKTEQHIEDWKAGKIRILLMHPASGGHGLNLQRGGHHIVWFGLNWSLEYYLQLNKRLHRQGQKHKTFIHHIVAEDTIDTKVINALARKDKTQNDMMDALKASIEEYL